MSLLRSFDDSAFITFSHPIHANKLDFQKSEYKVELESIIYQSVNAYFDSGYFSHSARWALDKVPF